MLKFKEMLFAVQLLDIHLIASLDVDAQVKMMHVLEACNKY